MQDWLEPLIKIVIVVLALQGAVAYLLPCVEIAEPNDWGPVDAALAELSTYQWLVFTSTNGVQAAEAANTYAAAYIEHRRAATVDDLTSTQKAIQRKIDELQGPLNDLDARIVQH